MTTEPLRGGAGELTARIEDIKRRLTWKNVDSRYGYTSCSRIEDIEWLLGKLEAALAAKAPQGVPATSKLADEVNQCLQIILTNAGNLEDGGPVLKERTAIEEAVDRAAKATWAALRCSEATPASKLPVPGPVSDDTIHQGMVPPAYAGHKLLQLTCNHERSTDTVLCECGWQKEFGTCGGAFDGWLEHAAPREAAAPKPAPPTFTESQVTSCDEAQSEDGSRSLGKEVPAPHSSVAATPAPGAERAALRERITEYLANGGLFNPENMEHAKVRELLRDVREALAAAPPAPTFGPGNYSCAVCGLGMVEPCEHWKAASNTSHVETEGESGRQPEVCHSPSAEEQEWLNAPIGDRHASAERVRELIVKWRKQDDQKGGICPGVEFCCHGMCADELERALPPSTGEKSQ